MTDNSENIILQISNLSVSFRKDKKWREVIHNISFFIKKGEALGLVGESGSGKSVSSLAVMNLLDKKNSAITSGNIFFYGKEKAMIFQEPMTALNPVKRCGHQVDEMILLHRNIAKNDAKNETLRLFKEVLLPDVERIYKSYPHELSGGQRQRVMIAMALSCNPQLLIADEPTTALDVTVQKTIIDLLKSLRQKYNMSILFISHDLGVVKAISDRIAVIYQGNIVETANTEDIFTNPVHPYTKSLIECSSFAKNTVNDAKQPVDKENTPLLYIKDMNIDYFGKRNLLGRIKNIFHAVNNVSFNVYKGETLGVVGESGSGKSTIGKAITRLIDISSGNVMFEGMNIQHLDRHQSLMLRKDIQIIFQDPYSSLNPRITIGHAISEPMQVYNMYNEQQRKQKVYELLEEVGLGKEFYHRYPHELSGGQRQRVGIARALALSPKLIICDESVSALDVRIQKQVLELLNKLKKEHGLTYIFISHDLSVVRYMSDRIIVLKKGCIEEQNSAENIYLHPQSSYTKNLIESSY